MASFRFKKFEVVQERSAMKVNTDGVLLGAWMNILPSDRTLLDIGTGSGVIALMAAQRVIELQRHGNAEHVCSGKCRILGIDIDAGSLEDAAENFSNFFETSFCRGKGHDVELEQLLVPVQNLKHHLPDRKFDLIFSNPPYFINALKSAGEAKSNARHTDTLSQGEMIRSALELLAPNGRLALVLPSAEAQEFMRKVEFIASRTAEGEAALRLVRLCKVHTLRTKPAKRWLMEFILACSAVTDTEQTSLAIQENGGYTAEYKAVTGDFYLNF